MKKFMKNILRGFQEHLKDFPKFQVYFIIIYYLIGKKVGYKISQGKFWG